MADWVTTEEAVRLSGYIIEYIRSLARSGKVKARKWGRDWQIGKSSLLAYKRQMEKTGEKRGPKIGT